MEAFPWVIEFFEDFLYLTLEHDVVILPTRHQHGAGYML
jgi:hypothetical protein